MNKYLIAVLAALTLTSTVPAFAEGSCVTIGEMQKEYPLGDITAFTKEQEPFVRAWFAVKGNTIPDSMNTIAIGKALTAKEGPVDPSAMIVLGFIDGCLVAHVSMPTQDFIDMMAGKKAEVPGTNS